MANMARLYISRQFPLMPQKCLDYNVMHPAPHFRDKSASLSARNSCKLLEDIAMLTTPGELQKAAKTELPRTQVGKPEID